MNGARKLLKPRQYFGGLKFIQVFDLDNLQETVEPRCPCARVRAEQGDALCTEIGGEVGGARVIADDKLGLPDKSCECVEGNGLALIQERPSGQGSAELQFVGARSRDDTVAVIDEGLGELAIVRPAFLRVPRGAARKEQYEAGLDAIGLHQPCCIIGHPAHIGPHRLGGDNSRLFKLKPEPLEDGKPTP